LPGLPSLSYAGGMQKHLMGIALFLTLLLAGCGGGDEGEIDCNSMCLARRDVMEVAACISECTAAWPKGAGNVELEGEEGGEQ
jgi:hypothetical protein